MSSVAQHEILGTPVGKSIEALQAAFGRLYDLMVVLACMLLLVMVTSITLDVVLRNVEIPGLPRGFPGASDISEYALYLCTLLAAPWLLRGGQHIRVDILLRAFPSRLAWACEWVSDAMAFGACVVLACMGLVVALRSYASGAIQIKSIVIPEWWVMAPLPIAFSLLTVEFAFRMWRLAHGPKEPRSDAVSAS
jgi:TRAP-type C4-dicarboxylate transport system permease small subunit